MPCDEQGVRRRQRLDLGHERLGPSHQPGDNRILVNRINPESHLNVESDFQPRLNEKVKRRHHSPPLKFRKKNTGEGVLRPLIFSDDSECFS